MKLAASGTRRTILAPILSHFNPRLCLGVKFHLSRNTRLGVDNNTLQIAIRLIAPRRPLVTASNVSFLERQASLNSAPRERSWLSSYCGPSGRSQTRLHSSSSKSSSPSSCSPPPPPPLSASYGRELQSDGYPPSGLPCPVIQLSDLLRAVLCGRRARWFSSPTQTDRPKVPAKPASELRPALAKIRSLLAAPSSSSKN